MASVASVASVAKVALVAALALVADEAKVALVAEEALPLKVAVIVPALKLPEASRATMVLAVFALVALLVTVKVAAVLWLAVKVCEPERPVPDTFIVNVPFWTLFAVVAVVARVANVANVARVASVAVVAKVAVVAEPAAILDCASQVGAAAPLLCRTCPEVPATEYACAEPVP